MNKREFPENTQEYSNLKTIGTATSFEESIQGILEPTQSGISTAIKTYTAVIFAIAGILGFCFGMLAVKPNLPELATCHQVAEDLWGAYLSRDQRAPLRGAIRGYYVTLSGNPIIIELENENAFGINCLHNGKEISYMVIPRKGT